MRNNFFMIIVVSVLFSCGSKKSNENYKNSNKVSFDYYQKNRNENNIFLSKDERLNYHATTVMFSDNYQTIYLLFDKNDNRKIFIHQNLIIRKDTCQKSYIVEIDQDVKSLVLEHIDSISYKGEKIKIFKYKLLTKGNGSNYIYWSNDIGLIAVDNYRFVLLCKESSYASAKKLNYIHDYVLKLIKESVKSLI